MNCETRLEKIFKQLKFLRFPVKRGHRCGEWLWQFGNSVDVIMKVRRVVVICQLLAGKQNLVCFDCSRGVLAAELRLTCGLVLFLLSWRCTRGAVCELLVISCHVVEIQTLSLSLSLSELLSPCRGHLLGQSFALSGCGRGPLQVDDHSGSCPHRSLASWLVFNGLREASGVAPEWPCSSGFARKSSRRAKAPSMRLSVLLNSFDNLFVSLPWISSKTWVM